MVLTMSAQLTKCYFSPSLLLRTNKREHTNQSNGRESVVLKGRCSGSRGGIELEEKDQPYPVFPAAEPISEGLQIR